MSGSFRLHQDPVTLDHRICQQPARHVLGRGLGFTYVISAGNEVDLGVLDYVEFLLEDPATKVILLYIEGLKAPERLSAVAARAAEMGKHLVREPSVGLSVEDGAVHDWLWVLYEVPVVDDDSWSRN